jgi:hypothetical protein
MKVKVEEYKNSFDISFVAEDTEEAAWITRFQLNVKREVPFISTVVSQEGEFRQWIAFSRKIERKSSIL